MRAVATIFCAGILWLSGCASEDARTDVTAADVHNQSNESSAPTSASSENPVDTASGTGDFSGPALEVRLETPQTVAVLAPFSDRRDASPGALRIWRVQDGVQIVLREGVLVATRGLGNDLGSTDASAAVATVQQRSPISGNHTLYVKTGENGVRPIQLACNMRTVGTETLTRSARPVETVHFRADCVGAGFVVAYDYWVDPTDRTVWQSRQWAGPDLGYMRTRLLKK